MEMFIFYLVGLSVTVGIGVFLLTAVTILQIYQVYIRRRWLRSIVLPSLTGYTPSPSYTVGQEVPVHVHTTQSATAILLRLGAEAVPSGWKRKVPSTQQSRHYDGWCGFSWPMTFAIETDGLSPGMYLLVLEHEGDTAVSFRIPFILSPKEPVDVAVVLATNTWQAYNDFGRLSNYRDQATPYPLRWLALGLKAFNWRLRVADRHYIPCVPLPEMRPNAILDADFRSLATCPSELPSHVGRADWALLRFLEREQIPHGVFSDRDFAFDPRPTCARLVIFAAHSEYWSGEMEGRLVSYLGNGGKVFFVSGNNTYQSVTFLDRALVVTDFRTEFERMARLTGLAYDARGFDTYAGFRVCDAEHFVFKDLLVRRGDIFAESPDGRGASGFETDKLHPAGSPVTVLAIGRNREGPAFMVFRDTGAGGWIVNTGSVATAAWIHRDRVLAGIVRNVIKRALQEVRAGSAHSNGLSDLDPREPLLR